MYFFWSLTNNFWLESVNSPSTNFAPVASTLWCQCLHGSSGNPPVTGSEAKRLIFSSSWSIPNIIQLDVWWYKYMSSWFYSCIMLCIYIYIKISYTKIWGTNLPKHHRPRSHRRKWQQVQPLLHAQRPTAWKMQSLGTETTYTPRSHGLDIPKQNERMDRFEGGIYVIL